jgi:glycosyltransferase involved in cell wall biosynthesis
VNPAGGGPLEGVRQRGLRLRELGHRVEVVTLDAPDEEFVAEFPLVVHAMGPPRSRYRYSPRLVPWLLAHVRDYDGLVVNGIWQYHSFAAWRACSKLKVPYVVFTHGMLDPWFRHAYPLKHFKKWLYWPWADYRVLRDAQAVLFTSEEERLQARRSFWLYRAAERVVVYGTTAPPENAEELRTQFFSEYPALRGRRIILFLSRIQEKKGCDLLIRAFAGIAQTDPLLQLVMAGPDQTGWVGALKSLAHELGVAERITWPGMLRGRLKWGAFYGAEVFALPSHQENFGIAVAEALGCGLPVLISDKVNIWREIEAAGAGMVAPDTNTGTQELLHRWLALTGVERHAMGESARGLFRRRFSVDAMARSLLEVLTQPSDIVAQEAPES